MSEHATAATLKILLQPGVTKMIGYVMTNQKMHYDCPENHFFFFNNAGKVTRQNSEVEEKFQAESSLLHVF